MHQLIQESSPIIFRDILKSRVFKVNLKDEEGDPLPEKLRDTVVSTFLFLVIFS